MGEGKRGMEIGEGRKRWGDGDRRGQCTDEYDRL